MTINILIVGAGAVGAFYASRLATTKNAQVSVICRSNYSVVAKDGFSVTSPTYGSYTFVPYKTFASPDQARAAEILWDYIVISTKALPDVSDDSAMISDLVGDTTSIVLIQNGLGVEASYAKRFPSSVLLSAVTVVSAAQESHGKIVHNRWTRISVGPYFPISSGKTEGDHKATKSNMDFISLLTEGGIKDAEAYTHSKLQLLRWHKIAINASMNPSSVLSGSTPNSVMTQDAELYIHLRGVMEEVLTTAEKIYGSLPKEFASAEKILESTKRNKSGSKPSMALDWEAGKTMELEVILGAPIRIAREKGIEMPRLQSMYALLKMAQTNRDKTGRGKL